MAVLTIACAQKEYNPKLLLYLKAEKVLRQKLSEDQGLGDSLKVLQHKYHINLEKELAKLRHNPEAWFKLIKDLKIGK